MPEGNKIWVLGDGVVANYHPGIPHLAGKDWMNMYQFARAVAGVFDMDNSLVNPVPVSADLPPKRLRRKS